MRTKLSRRRPHKNSSGKFPVPKPAKKFWLPPTGETPSTSQVQSTPRADIAKSDTDSASDITCPEDDESFLSKMQQKKAQEDDNSTEDNISIHSSDLNFSENSDDTPFTYFNKAYNKEYIHQRIKGASMEECDVVAEKKAFKVMDIWSCREDKKEKSTGAAEGTSFSHKEDHTLDEGMEIAAEAQGVQPTGAVDDVEEAQGVQPTAAVDDVKEAQGVQPTAAVNDEEVQLRAEPFSIHEDNEERPFGRILVQLGKHIYIRHSTHTQSQA